ncbi:MAG: FAD-binding oxidoreductase [Deltaproteobacteria bacterium]|nr:FAD-binding oxidoreductase [Deltaproteobacteria bacterium]MBW2120222.1 FAD-binding oxidoreductase [Deltaproteobacteria bacterium]
MKSKDKALAELERIVGEENFSADEVDLIPYTRDSYSALMGRDIPMPDCVVLPEHAGEVQSIVAVANEYGLPLYPRSFGVNIAGAAIPYGGGIVIDLKRMNRIHEVNPETMTATIEPGVTWGALRKAARPKGLDAIAIGGPYCVGPVGNFLFTNITHYATVYSMDRAVTFEAVLPNGEIIRTGSQATRIGSELNPYFRYAYGPDVAGLFRGSMGNYGIITKMVIRLRPIGKIEESLIYGFNDLDSALRTMQSIERLEITRSNVVYNKDMAMHAALSPEEQRRPEERRRVLDALPPYIMVPGIKGDERLIGIYREIMGEEVAAKNGTLLGLAPEIADPVITLAEGASNVSLRMYAPFSGFGAAIGCLPVTKVVKMTDEVIELAEKFDVRDPLSGERQYPELVIIPYDRCSTVYVEQELLYDPADQEETRKVFECIREVYRVMVLKYGAVHTIPNRSFLDRVALPSYSNLIRGIKKLVDPNGIMMAHGPYSFEQGE